MLKLFLYCFLAAAGTQTPDCYTVDKSVTRADLESFNTWRHTYNKTYVGETNLSQYFKAWHYNRQFIEQHNQQNNDFTMELNQFADTSRDRWRTGPQYNKHLAGRTFSRPLEEKEVLGLPAHVDWRQKGVVTPVKNQQQCGSCWTFSATGSMEAQHALSTGRLLSLSESQIVDCDKSDDGCGGGFMDDAFRYVIASDGIETEQEYPYKPIDQNCSFNATKIKARFSGFHDVTGGEAGLKRTLATVGPISVAIDASDIGFQMYKDGVYYNPDCSTTILDHGVLAVGYGTTSNGTDYWIVKNSWGAVWGNKGYIWMSRNRGNNCGIATMASYPVSSTAGPRTGIRGLPSV